MSDFIDFKTLTRPPKPNTCLAAPDGLCEAARVDFAPPIFDQTQETLLKSLTEIIRAERGWSKLVTDSTSGRQRFIAVTPFLRFKDDIDIQLVPVTEASTTLAIYSRSRVGYSDFGTNRKRVDALIASLTRN